MDCDAAGIEKDRYDETSNVNHGMLIKFGWKKVFIEELSQIVDQEAERLDKVHSAFTFFTDHQTGERERCATFVCTTKEFCAALGHYSVTVAASHCDLIKNMITGASKVGVVAIAAPVYRQSMHHSRMINLLSVLQI